MSDDSSGYHIHSEYMTRASSSDALEVLVQTGQHLHYDGGEDGSVRARPCSRTDCDKVKPLSGSMAAVMASVKR